MDISGVIKPAMLAWLKGAIDLNAVPVGSPPITVYWDNPQAPRPLSPSVRIKIIMGPTRVGMDVLADDGNGNLEVSGYRTFMLSVNAYGDLAQQILSDLQTSVYDPVKTADLSAAGLSILYTSEPHDIPEMLHTKVEQRYQMNVKMSAVERKLTGAQYAASVTIESNLSNLPLEAAAAVTALDVIFGGIVPEVVTDLIDGGDFDDDTTDVIYGGDFDEP